MKLKELLPEAVSKLLTEDSLTALQTAIEEKQSLTVEAALVEQDDLYVSKLSELLEARDLDYAKKFQRALKAQASDFTVKLKNVIKRNDQTLTVEAKKFTGKLVESISDYLEISIDEAIPTEAILEATQNRTSNEVLKNLRSVLSVDTALMSESVKAAVIDGKSTIDALQNENNILKKRNKTISESSRKVEANLLLEQKTNGMPEGKKDYLVRVLADKEPKFIAENFEYTAKLFEKQDKKDLKVLREAAFKKRVVKEDAPSKAAPVLTPRHQPINESSKPAMGAYLEGLGKAK